MFKKFKKIILVVTIFSIMSICFLFYWKYPFSKEKKNVQPSSYEKITQDINKKICGNFNEEDNFIIKNKNIYGTLTALNLAKKYISCNNFDKSILQLNNALEYTKEENLKNILKLRIAKINIQKGQYQNAINILCDIKNENWNNIIENMKGDIFKKMNNNELAKKHWEISLSKEESNASKEIIKMKINEMNK